MTSSSFKKIVSGFVWSKFGFVVVFLLALLGLGTMLEYVIVVITYLWEGLPLPAYDIVGRLLP